MLLSRLSRPVLLAALFCQVANHAIAQQPSQAQANAIRQSCRSDYQAHCASVPPGGTASLQCLKDNIAVLSPGCQAAVGPTGGAGTSSPSAAAPPANPPTTSASPASPMPPMTLREEAALMRGACGGDFRTLCRGVALGGGRAVACLADHRESLSPRCREAMAAARGGH